jgi:adenylosuccinate synthase
MSKNRIQIVQGGQYGSEAKGAVAAHLCVTEDVDIAVRTGATNAGHTAWYEGAPYVMQQLPIGWVRQSTVLVLGAGTLVDPEILHREIAMIHEATGIDPRRRLMIDRRAYIHQRKHAARSAESGRHVAMGATGKGCSEAMISRLRLRAIEDWTVGANREMFQGILIADTEEYLNMRYDQGAKIQLEGTQGQLLDLCLGPYPYVTHKTTGPAQWMSECGLSPTLPTDIVMVIRTYPIRVAGNSGPLPKEISWPGLARRINRLRAAENLAPIVSERAICAFESAVLRTADGFDAPDTPLGSGLMGPNQHLWTAEQRVEFRDALSNHYKEALADMSEVSRNELANLFEMTTVTRKLRRIADLDLGELRRSARQMRPNRVVVTFMNYVFPERWFTGDPVDAKEREYLATIEKVCGAPVTLINRGPRPEHFVEV